MKANSKFVQITREGDMWTIKATQNAIKDLLMAALMVHCPKVPSQQSIRAFEEMLDEEFNTVIPSYSKHPLMEGLLIAWRDSAKILRAKGQAFADKLKIACDSKNQSQIDAVLAEIEQFSLSKGDEPAFVETTMRLLREDVMAYMQSISISTQA